jgi:glycosyltransferase involved in cell wall biosynthesis
VTISIITVVYNGENTIRDTIESVLSQDLPNLEYIIIDGKSSDSTVDIIKSYGNQITRFLSEQDGGIYDAMNKGIRLATGDIIGILNSDDLYANNQILSEVAQKFNCNTIDAVYGDLVYVDGNDLGRIRRNWKAGEYQEGLFLWGWMPPHPTFFIRKEWYEKHGDYRLDLGSAADYELMLRMIHKHKANPSYIPEVMVRMRVGGISNSKLKNRIDANKMDRKAWAVNGLVPYPVTLLLKPVRKLFQFLG